jgi:hypothetical protein
MVPPTDSDIRRTHEYMRKCQDARAFKRNQYPVFVQLKVGDVVNVRATPKELKDHIALAPWSAKGVIHAVSTYSLDVFSVRWLTNGLSAGKTKRGVNKTNDVPGRISHMYSRGFLKKVPNADAAMVHHTVDGTVMIHAHLPDGDCNYVYLDGEWKWERYSTAVAAFDECKSELYSDWMSVPEPQPEPEPEDEEPGDDVGQDVKNTWVRPTNAMLGQLKDALEGFVSPRSKKLKEAKKRKASPKQPKAKQNKPVTGASK